MACCCCKHANVGLPSCGKCDRETLTGCANPNVPDWYARNEPVSAGSKLFDSGGGGHRPLLPEVQPPALVVFLLSFFLNYLSKSKAHTPLCTNVAVIQLAHKKDRQPAAVARCAALSHGAGSVGSGQS